MTCCTDIEAIGFTDKFLNGIYTFTGTYISGRHLYVKENKVFGIWFNGEYGDEAAWEIGYMTSITKNLKSYSAYNINKDTSCASLTKVWKEYFNKQWTYSTKATVKCVSGDN